MVYKVFHGLAPPALKELINLKTNISTVQKNTSHLQRRPYSAHGWTTTAWRPLREAASSGLVDLPQSESLPALKLLRDSEKEWISNNQVCKHVHLPQHLINSCTLWPLPLPSAHSLRWCLSLHELCWAHLVLIYVPILCMTCFSFLLPLFLSKFVLSPCVLFSLL